MFREQLDEAVAWRIFGLMERYLIATEGVAFPLPQGFNSFFAFLAYRCLSHHVFMQYVRRGVLQLNVDVLREIIYGKSFLLVYPFGAKKTVSLSILQNPILYKCST